MRHENADEFMDKLKERADARKNLTEISRAAFIEGMTWGMVNELIIERDQTREALNMLSAERLSDG